MYFQFVLSLRPTRFEPHETNKIARRSRILEVSMRPGPGKLSLINFWGHYPLGDARKASAPR